PALLRLRARAQLAAGDWAAAASTLEAAARHAGDEPDPWTEATRPAVRAAAAGEPYATRGDASAELPLEALPLPVVRVRVDALETLAVVGSGAHFAVLDPSVRATAGAIDELTLGALRVRDVPHTVRSLEAVREALGADVGMVIGADLLLRLHATLDGPGGRLVLHAERPARPDTTTAPLLRPTGAFLAVPARVGAHEGWLTLDTAGLFPVALGPGGDEALGLADAAWQATAQGPSMTVADVRLGALHAEGLPLVRGLLDESHARAVGAPVAGSLGWTVLSQLAITFDAPAGVLRFE
ncbi:MAG TPA: hypothetical protein RMH99_31475, partial [Sandaracinaceae bacterium LLY-WYZ-13_1]|nr:hypothetical protein [Sandaracinaceae bacterium LLY-WYZ-13_1]